MHRLLAIILAGGTGERLSILSQRRAKPAVPFAGKYRIIDFALSNCINSGISKVIVLTQYQPVSLMEHIGIGTPWGFVPPDRAIRLLQPYLARETNRDWYQGTADAVFQNMDRILAEDADEAIILSGDHVYKMDYSRMLEFHRAHKADVTLAVTPMPEKELHRFGTVTADENNRVTGFQEKVKKPRSDLVSMGVYIFSMPVLRKVLENRNGDDFGRHIFPSLVGNLSMYAYTFEGYWRDIGTVDSFWQANMEILSTSQSFLSDDDWPIYTKEKEGAPTKIGHRATATNLLLSHSCLIEGHVEHSVIFPGVYIAEGAVVKDSIIMNNTSIGANCIIDRAILDKDVVIKRDSHIGWGDDFRINRLSPKILNSGLTLIGKGTTISAGYRVGRNCIIFDGITESDLPPKEVASGETVKTKRKSARKHRK